MIDHSDCHRGSEDVHLSGSNHPLQCCFILTVTYLIQCFEICLCRSCKTFFFNLANSLLGRLVMISV